MPRMDAARVVEAVLAARPTSLYVAALGTATSALRKASGDGPHLYMGGSMGSALAVALGVSERCRDRDVIALLGDGEMLMGAGTLWSFADLRPPNLTAVVLNDGHYTITGGQRTANGHFAEVARALGLDADVATCPGTIEAALGRIRGPALLEVRYDERVWPGPSPFVDGPVVRWRFEQAVSAVRSAGEAGAQS